MMCAFQRKAARQKATLSSLFFFYFPLLAEPAFFSTLMPSLFNPLEREAREKGGSCRRHRHPKIQRWVLLRSSHSIIFHVRLLFSLLNL